MRRYEHVSATTVQEAVKLLSVQNARLVAGGTDLMAIVKDGLLPTDRIVDLKRIPGLDVIAETNGELSIGAAARLADVAASKAVKDKAPSLAQAALAVATPQIRNMGTLGGNISQKVRCWYYRDADRDDCYKRNGSNCYAIMGRSDLHAIFDGAACFAATPSDTAVALTALDAKMVIAGPEGHRTLPATEFFIGPDVDYMRETNVAANEIVTEIRIPAGMLGQPSVFLKAAPRRSIDFARASVGVTIVGSPVIQTARVVLGAVAPTPKRAIAAEEYLAGKRLQPDVVRRALELALDGARPLRTNAYKIELTRGLLRQAFARLGA